ncbi:hypothetical protein Avbf_10387 [Armadillidium vulgare]|nr:hypothetical protein Avbf_10387 [Armadillidium vulgare]
MNGKACLLRTICELHTQPLFGYGLVGEIIELFLTVSSSDDPLNILEEYLEAELNGKSSTGCSRYKAECPLSLFRRPSKKHRLLEEKVRQKFME